MKEKIFILVKTYPTFSKKYSELVCTAGINEKGEWRRLYPIPFRELKELDRYKKYQWIEVTIQKASDDPRPESYKLVPNSDINIINLKPISTKNCWQERKDSIKQIIVFENKKEIIEKAHVNELSLVCFKPKQILSFEYEETEREWNKNTRKYIEAKNSQGDLFQEFKKEIKLIKKLPYKFFYKFLDNENIESRLMIEDWEIGQLYWNCLKNSRNEQEALEKVRQKYEGFITHNEIMLFLGTTREFHIRKAKNPFVITGIFYPLKNKQYFENDLFT